VSPTINRYQVDLGIVVVVEVFCCSLSCADLAFFTQFQNPFTILQPSLTPQLHNPARKPLAPLLTRNRISQRPRISRPNPKPARSLLPYTPFQADLHLTIFLFYLFFLPSSHKSNPKRRGEVVLLVLNLGVLLACLLDQQLNVGELAEVEETPGRSRQSLGLLLLNLLLTILLLTILIFILILLLIIFILAIFILAILIHGLFEGVILGFEEWQ
jgi:hypothetical protein